MPPAAEPPAGSLRGHAARRPSGLLLDIGGVVHSTAMHLVGRLAETEPVRVPWDDPSPAIDTARTLLRLPPRQPGDDY